MPARKRMYSLVDIDDGNLGGTDCFGASDEDEDHFSNDELSSPSSPETQFYSTSTPVNTERQRRRSRCNESSSSLGDVTNTTMNQSQLILDEIKKTNSRLDQFGDTLKSVQQRLQMVEKDLTSMGPSSSADTSMESWKKEKVP